MGLLSALCCNDKQLSIQCCVFFLSGRQTSAAACRLEGGELEFAEHAHNEDMGGIESLVDLDAGFADDEEYDEVCKSHLVCVFCRTAQCLRYHAQAGLMHLQDDEDLPDGDRLVADDGLLKEKKGLLGPKKEADYDYFVSDIWPRISTKEEKQSMTAPLVWQVMLFALDWAALLYNFLATVLAG